MVIFRWWESFSVSIWHSCCKIENSHITLQKPAGHFALQVWGRLIRQLLSCVMLCRKTLSTFRNLQMVVIWEWYYTRPFLEFFCFFLSFYLYYVHANWLEETGLFSAVDGKHPGSDQSYFGRREFSFSLSDDRLIRFLSFNTLSELEKSIKEKCPMKIDIGPVYSVDVWTAWVLWLLYSVLTTIWAY